MTVVLFGCRFANLPESVKAKTEDPSSMYSFGWSHGKEMLEGKPDYSKGSYYANPQYDTPFSDQPELAQQYPSFCRPNIWPTEDLPELQPAFKALGQLMVEVGLLVAKQCDSFVKSQLPTYPNDRLHNIIKTAKTCKARLLHYFPVDHLTTDAATTPVMDGDDVSSWCGWHNDHGSLTGLCPAMYINRSSEEVANPDSSSGLYIRSRTGNLVQVKIPADYLAFQIGETAQIHSGGCLQATPHCVRAAQGPAAAGVSRETFAVFMEPMWDEQMDIPQGADISNVQSGSSSKYLPKGIVSALARCLLSFVAFVVYFSCI
jgi:isopenicillin N synthase-like dioxygenase